jgi:hypothetical protein
LNRAKYDTFQQKPYETIICLLGKSIDSTFHQAYDEVHFFDTDHHPENGDGWMAWLAAVTG